MKRRLILLLILLLLPCFPISAAAKNSAAAAIVIEASTGAVLYQKNADKRLPEASTTKIMTALLVLENARTDGIVRVSAAAANVEGSQLGLGEGDEITVSDLLYILMLKSGNDAAVALAEHTAGSQTAFAALMNQKAAVLGMNGTQFRNPHGLPDDEHYTTARDMAVLTAAAMENEAFRALVATRRATLEYHGVTLSNSNRLLTSCEGVCGVKTGYTKKAGRCLVSAARRNGILLICVTLNDPDDWVDHAALYDACFPRVGRKEIFPAGGWETTVSVLGGTAAAKASNLYPLSVITVDGIPAAYRIEAETAKALFAPVPEGKIVGTVSLRSARGGVICSSPLRVRAPVAGQTEKPPWTRRFFQNLQALIDALIS